MYETGAVWTLAGPDGTTLQFNAGGSLILEEATGFDSPNVRENVEDLPERDGAVAGKFWFGARPVTLSGRIISSSAADRNATVMQLQQALRALRSDATLSSQPQGMPGMQTSARLQNFRVTGGFVKQFQIGLICPDPRIYSQTLNHVLTTTAPSSGGAAFPWIFPVNFGGGSGGTANVSVSNAGNMDSFPIIRVTGPATNPQLKNATTGEQLQIDNVDIAAGAWIEADCDQRTVRSSDGITLYGRVRFPPSVFWTLAPGANEVQLWADSSSAGVQLDVFWRDAWA
jgi:hypothetical protein